MALKDVLVYSRTHKDFAAHVRLAARLAAHHGARLTGIFVQKPHDGLAEPKSSAACARLQVHDLQAATNNGLDFLRLVESIGVDDADWQVACGYLPVTLAHSGASHDVLVLDIGEHAAANGLDPIEEVLLESRVPCLLVPTIADETDVVFDRIAIAWNGSTEAMRAVRSALPLLAAAKRVVLFAGEPRNHGRAMPVPPHFDLEAWLRRRSVCVEVQAIANDEPAGAALLAACARDDIQLLVMGAYGLNRFSEWALGGATHHILREAQIPVWMQH